MNRGEILAVRKEWQNSYLQISIPVSCRDLFTWGATKTFKGNKYSDYENLLFPTKPAVSIPARALSKC